jgi:hypothetical protein
VICATVANRNASVIGILSTPASTTASGDGRGAAQAANRRPPRRPGRRPISGTRHSGDELSHREWFIADFAADLRYANALGADAVLPNAGSLDAGNPGRLRGYTLFLGACERAMAAGPRFRTRIMGTQDFAGSPGTTYADGRAIAAKLHTALRGVAQHSGRRPKGKSYTPYLQEDKRDSPALFRIDGKPAFSVWASRISSWRQSDLQVQASLH